MNSEEDKITKNNSNSAGAEEAVNLIRQKIENIYHEEPKASEEIKEIVNSADKLSPHQKYIQKLTESGMSLAEIQATWHKYYSDLPDAEKHKVWEEFYRTHRHIREYHPANQQKNNIHNQSTKTDNNSRPQKKLKHHRTQTVASIKHQLLRKTQDSQKRITARQHLKSLIFGLSLGSLVLLVFLFSFFNERFLAPFITPSKQVSSTPIINDPYSTTADPQPKVIIPKINVEIPTVYSEPSVEEKAIQKALEQGVVHYATTPYPGEKGNSVIFGHSSNNILNKGKYKFAFVLLNKLDIGDVFYLTRDSVRYSYKVYDKRIVKPTDLSVLGNTNKTATATLITCDPPGTSVNRLIVIGEQVNPEPNLNKPSTAMQSDKQPVIIPSNSPSLWQRLVNWLSD